MSNADNQIITVAVVHQNYSENKKQFSIILNQDVMVRSGLSFNDQVSVLFGEPFLNEYGETTMLVTLQKYETKGVKTWKISREKASKDTNGRIKISIASKNKILFKIQNENINRVACSIVETNRNNKTLTFILPKEFISNTKEHNRSILDFSGDVNISDAMLKLTPRIKDEKIAEDTIVDIETKETHQDYQSLISVELFSINDKIKVINDIRDNLLIEKRNIETIILIDCLNDIHKKIKRHHVYITINAENQIYIEGRSKNKKPITFGDHDFLNSIVKKYGYQISFNDFVCNMYESRNTESTHHYDINAIKKTYPDLMFNTKDSIDLSKIKYPILNRGLISIDCDDGASW